MSDRLISLVRTIVNQMIPNAKFMGHYEYRVESWESDAVSCSIISKATGLPDMVKVSLTPAVTGGRAKLVQGAVVVVGFRNADPTLPYVVHGDPNAKVDELWVEADGTIHVDGASVILNGGVLGVARQTDAVQAGPFSGIITAGSTTVKAG